MPKLFYTSIQNMRSNKIRFFIVFWRKNKFFVEKIALMSANFSVFELCLWDEGRKKYTGCSFNKIYRHLSRYIRNILFQYIKNIPLSTMLWIRQKDCSFQHDIHSTTRTSSDPDEVCHRTTGIGYLEIRSLFYRKKIPTIIPIIIQKLFQFLWEPKLGTLGSRYRHPVNMIFSNEKRYRYPH